MSNRCLRCKQPIPDDQVTVRGVWAEDAIPSAQWGDQTYHAGCFDAARAERGYPMTAWTSPPTQRHPLLMSNAVVVGHSKACDCLSRAPSYPVFRSTIHLPDCPHWWGEMAMSHLKGIIGHWDEFSDQPGCAGIDERMDAARRFLNSAG